MLTWVLRLQTFFLKGFFIVRFLKSVQSYYFSKVLLFNSSNMPEMLESLAKLCHILEHAQHLIKKKILFPCSNARDVPVKFYITYIIISIVF